MSDGKPIEVLGISGSLRQDSFNTAALRAARELAPDDMHIRIRTLEDIPVYNADVEAEGYPAPVEALRSAISAAGAVLFATPEYNASIPGVLKNAVDWVSRPPEQEFEGKPIAIMGASPGRLGTARAQSHLRQCFVSLDGKVLNGPEIMIAGAGDVFDDDGRLIDASTRERIAKMLEALAAWTRRMGRD
jgi:chromate reductase